MGKSKKPKEPVIIKPEYVLDPKTQPPRKKKKKNAPDRPQPEWMFPPDKDNPILNPKVKSDEQTQTEKDEHDLAIKFLKYRAVGAPLKAAPPPLFLTLVGAFLSSYGFDGASRIYTTQLNARKRLDGWQVELEHEVPNGIPDLVKIFKDWYRQFALERNDETSSSGSESSDDGSSGSDSDSSTIEEEIKSRPSTSSSPSSESEPPTSPPPSSPPPSNSEKSSKRRPSVSSTSSDSSSESEPPTPPPPSKSEKSSKRKRSDSPAEVSKSSKKQQHHKVSTPFQRVPKDTIVNPKLASNAYQSYDYADRAHQDLSVTRGKGFTKEKNKKKKGSYKGGMIDTSGGKGIKFDD